MYAQHLVELTIYFQWLALEWKSVACVAMRSGGIISMFLLYLVVPTLVAFALALC
jgi:hypothetical protein